MNGPVANSISQGILAKLLASENITVHVGNYSTAFFDVKNRILGLPSWNVDSKAVSDMLIGHEVGHALWTPQEGTEKVRIDYPHIPFDVFNVVEDVRIERMIKSRYPGLISSFRQAYTEFLRKDFFRVGFRDMNTLGFLNRLNIKGKCGDLVNIKFSAEEQVFFDRCVAAETFEEVVAIAVDIYKFTKTEKPEPKPEQFQGNGSDDSEIEFASSPTAPDPDDEEPEDEDPKDGEGEEDAEDDGDEPEVKQSKATKREADETPEEETPEKEDKPESSDDRSAGDGNEDDFESTPDEDDNEDLDASTLTSLTEELDKLHTNFGDVMPVLAPSKRQLSDCVIPWKEVIRSREAKERFHECINDEAVKADWISYKKETKKIITPLITDFERKKAAFQYSRSKTSDTGDINVNKLHQYRFEDQIFNSVTQLANSKNHGMMFFIDYSGSMADDIYNVLDHTLNLVMFCNAVKIPYQVFGFTSSNNLSEDRISKSEVPVNEINLTGAVIFEILSSDMKPKELDNGMRHIRAQIKNATCGSVRYNIFFGPYEYMMGTPLNEVLIVAHSLVAKFRAKYHIQKMNVLILSDGDGQFLSFGNDGANKENMYTPARSARFFTVNLGGKEVKLTKSDTFNYALLINNLRETMNCTVIGFFLTRNKRDMKSSAVDAYRHSKKLGMTSDHAADYSVANAMYEKETANFRKNKMLFISNGFNYNGYFVIDTRDSKISKATEFKSDLDDNDFDGPISVSTQHKLAKDFTKFTSVKKTSRVILSKFAELIA